MRARNKCTDSLDFSFSSVCTFSLWVIKQLSARKKQYSDVLTSFICGAVLALSLSGTWKNPLWSNDPL